MWQIAQISSNYYEAIIIMKFSGNGDRVKFPEKAKTELIFEEQAGVVIEWKGCTE